MLKYLVLLTGAFHLQAGATPVLLLPLTAGSYEGRADTDADT
jgi:hypothetical protein